jgi:predicted lipid-binding transport protein (Tim44 family)
VLSAAAPLLRALPRGRWRAPLSLGVGVPFLLGSTPAAAAGSADIVLGGVTTWLGVLAALFTLLAPRQPADVAGAVAVLGIAATLFAVVVSHRRRGRAPAAIAALARERGAVVASPARRHWPIDAGQVLEAARARFLGLQAAWDAGDVQALGHLTTPDMLQELLQVLTTRASDATRTDVVTLHAELLDIEELGAAWLASVEFSGLIRESAERGAVPFRELWMLAATKEGAPSWRLARQQALF